MKTTFILSDLVMRQLKRRAAEEGRSLSSMVEDAVRVYLSASPRTAKPLPPLPTHDGGGFRVNVASRDALYEAMEQGS